MATKKIQIRPKGDGDYADILHPETDSDVVLHGTQTLNAKLASVDGAIEALQEGKLDADGTIESANKLSTVRTLDGLDFDGSSNNTHYAISTSGVTAQNKVVVLNGFNLVEGARISVKFTNGNLHSTPSLNVNSFASKPILKANGKALTSWQAGAVYTFIYDGSNFIVQGEGGEYGNATASDVVAGKTIGTENGLVTGTLVPRQMATGTWTSTSDAAFYYSDGTLMGSTTRYVQVSGLAFRPRTVIMKGGTATSGVSGVVVYTQELDGVTPSGQYEVITCTTNGIQGGNVRAYSGSTGMASITADGFVLPIYSGSLIGDIEWVAFS